MTSPRRAQRVRWDQRAMAGLAVYYLVLFAALARLVLHEDADDGLWSLLVLAAALACLLWIRNWAVFTVLASMAGLLLVAAFCVIPPYAPAGLPLLLAQIRPSPALLAVIAAGLTWLAWVFLHWP